jgi:hypothetical protein
MFLGIFQDFLHVFLGVLVEMGLGRWACFWEFFRISFSISDSKRCIAAGRAFSGFP